MGEVDEQEGCGQEEAVEVEAGLPAALPVPGDLEDEEGVQTQASAMAGRSSLEALVLQPAPRPVFPAPAISLLFFWGDFKWCFLIYV